jgi:hypothetical protein
VAAHCIGWDPIGGVIWGPDLDAGCLKMRTRYARHRVMEALGSLAVVAGGFACTDDQTICDFNMPGDARSSPSLQEAGNDVSGAVQVTIGNATCPAANPFSIGPNNGGSMNLRASISPGSLPEGGTEAFRWSAPSGSFSDPTALETMYTCSAPGSVTITFTVSTDGGCSEQASGTVLCD